LAQKLKKQLGLMLGLAHRAGVNTSMRMQGHVGLNLLGPQSLAHSVLK